MHRSRVSTFLIDVRRDDVDRATGFWAKALGDPAYFTEHSTIWGSA